MASFKDFVRKRHGAPDPLQSTPATRALPPVPAQPQILLVTTANLFVWDSSNRTVDMTKRPTGGLTLTHALARHVVHALGGSVVAVDFVRDDYDVAERRWEGIPVKCVRRGAAMQLDADVVVTTSMALDVVRWAAAHCEGRYCAMCHDYSGAPWGPFGHVEVEQREPLRDALAGWHLLCDSNHVTAYHRRFGPASVTPRLCYGACYGYFRAPPLYRNAVDAPYVTLISPCAPKGLSILAAIAPRLLHVTFLCVATAWTNTVVQQILKRFPNVVVEAGSTPRLCYGACYGYFRAPPLYRNAVDAPYVTLISPCAPKGLSILAAIAPRLLHVTFLCVATAWTNTVVQQILKRFPNVVVEAGSPDVDVFYRRTKVLLVPSIWPEAFGLVATEAAARGIPVLSTDFGGLAEANPVQHLQLPTRWFYDHSGFRLLRCHLDDAMARPQSEPPADVLEAASGEERRERVAKHLFHCLLHVAPADVADQFVVALTRLLADGPFYAAAARESREGRWRLSSGMTARLWVL